MAAQAALIKNLFAFAVRQSGGHSRCDYGMIGKVAGKIIDEFVFGIGGYFGAPADHLVDFANPLVPRQSLLKNRLGAVTDQASIGNDIPAGSIGQLVLLGSAKSNVRKETRDGDTGYNPGDKSDTMHVTEPCPHPCDAPVITVFAVSWADFRCSSAFVHYLDSSRQRRRSRKRECCVKRRR